MLNPVVETLRAMGQSAVGAVPAGLTGLYELARTRDPEQAEAAMGAVSDAFAYQPESLEAQSALRALGDAGQVLEAPFKWAGQQTMDLTGSPAAAAAVESVPQVLTPTAWTQRALRGPSAGLDPMPGPIGRQRGAMPVGGPPAVGLLGERMPETTDILQAQLDEAGYTLGSAPGVYTHGDIGKQQARGTLNQAERDMVSKLPRNRQQVMADALRDYRSKHHPAMGWADVTPQRLSFTKQGNPKIEWQMQAPMFHIDQATGKPYTGAARANRVEDLSNTMVAEVQDLVKRAGQGDTNAQFIVDQSRWYKDAERTIKDLFGTKGQLYADVQGSLSPNTRLSQQHVMAQEVFERFLKGDFDQQLAKFDAHMAKKPADVGDSTWANKLRDKNSSHYDPDAIIRKESGALYGMNSINAMQALRNLIGTLEPGQAPKMRTFAGNLGGRNPDTTVDVWAGRTVQRLSGLPRIPPAADKGVPGVIAAPSELLSAGQRRAMDKAARGEQLNAAETRQLEKAQQAVPKPDITGQYGLGSDVFRTAAAKLGMDPDDLQALMWFREKELWESQGWTPVDAQPSLVEHIQRDNPPTGALVQSLRGNQ